MAQFLSQKEIDAGVLRSVTLAQIDEIKPRRLASVVDEWKKLTKSDAPPSLAVTIVYYDYLGKIRRRSQNSLRRRAMLYNSDRRIRAGWRKFCKKPQT
ncbi:MAG TPA: hypothetical protein VFY96_01525 [Candidatus Binatia bacterium]|nr:hypothetical protein [Candidatus Binatia bacterium]